MDYHSIWSQVWKYFLLSYAVYYAFFLASVHFLEYRHEARLFLEEKSLFDFTLGMDNIYFINNEYVWEHNYAFLPGYVVVLKVLRLLASLAFTDDVLQKKCFLIFGLLLNAVFTALASVNLFRLTELLTERKDVAKIACIVFYFCTGGAALRMLYSEAFFCFLLFWAVRLAYEKMAEWQPKIDSPLQFLRINALSLLLFWIASTVRSTLVLISPVFGLPILQTLYVQLKGDRKISRLLKIAVTGAVTLFVFYVFLPVWNLFGYWQFCTIESPSWFCSSTVLNMYNAVQVRHWGIKFRFFLDFFTQGFDNLRLGLAGFYLVTIAFNFRYKFSSSAGLVLSYVLTLFVALSWGYLVSLNRFLTTHPLFLVNMALFLVSDRTSQPDLRNARSCKQARTKLYQILAITIFVGHLTESTIKLGRGGIWS